MHANEYVINLSAIKKNIKNIRSILPLNTRFVAVIKANAYGSDAFKMLCFLQKCGIDLFAVASLQEAIFLKKMGVEQKIFVINIAFFEVEEALKYDFELGVGDKHTLKELLKRVKKPTRIHLNVNTGMNRLGFSQKEIFLFAPLISSHPFLFLEGLMTHFVSADNPKHDGFTKKQAKALFLIYQTLKKQKIEIPYLHAANSAATIRFNFPFFNMVRVGLALYGYHTSGKVQRCLSLVPATTLKTKVVAIHRVQPCASVGYGKKALNNKEEKVIATLPLGYYDGIHRKFEQKGFVFVKGRKAKIVSVCMDFIMIDITDIKDVKVGDRVTIFGYDEKGRYISADIFAKSGKTIVHELLTCLGGRIKKVFVKSQRKVYVS